MRLGFCSRQGHLVPGKVLRLKMSGALVSRSGLWDRALGLPSSDHVVCNVNHEQKLRGRILDTIIGMHLWLLPYKCSVSDPDRIHLLLIGLHWLLPWV